MTTRNQTFAALTSCVWLTLSAASLAAQPKSATTIPEFQDRARLDDGSVETGYGFVPSAKWGEVIQRFERNGLAGELLTGLCVCWLKKRGDMKMDFEVVLYSDLGGRPGSQALWAEKASATVEARTREEAGAVDCVDVQPRPLPETFFLGVRWDPGEEAFAFVCADHSEATAEVPGFFREDRAQGWTSALEARDPNFQGHRAVVLWPRAALAPLKAQANASSIAIEEIDDSGTQR